MNEEIKYIEEQEESSIDFGKIFQDIKKHRRLYYKVLGITFVVAAIIALTTPNYYKCEVMLSPELSTKRSTSSLAALASSFGVNLGMGSGAAGSEALFPTLYPELVNSVDFKASLFPVKVTIEGNKKKGTKDRTMTYYDYLKDEQKSSLLGTVLSAPGAFIGWVFSLFMEKEEVEAPKEINPFRLTKEQTAIAKIINENVICDVDKKTLVISICVTDQNPVICATMADSVKTRLQNFITDYRTSKARVDLEYNKKIFAEVKDRYEAARQRFANFSDSNRGIQSQQSITKLSKLQTEMMLQQTFYQQVASQLQDAEMKVQEETPAFTTLQSATVPIKKAGPSRAKTCLVFLFLAFLATTAWVLYKEDDLKSLLGMS